MSRRCSALRHRFRARWTRILVGVVAALLLCFALAAVAAYAILRGSLPQTKGNVALAALEHPVSIHFDAWQRPYVQAEILTDALAAEGWLHASHRLWQMELFRRAGRGRLAELLGPSALGTDQELYRIGVPQLAANLRRNASPEFLHYLDAYVAGVNAGIAHLQVRPPEFLLLRAEIKPWTSDDVFALGALMAYQSANNLQNELLRWKLSQKLDTDRLQIFLTDSSQQPGFPFVLPPDTAVSPPAEPRPAAHRAVPTGASATIAGLIDRVDLLDPASNPLMPRIGLGSNGWVAAPTKSATGHALFAFDSHDELGLPNLFYEVHLFFGRGKQIRGWSVAGLPGVVNGYNHRIAWGFTNIGDTQDLFLETPHPEDHNRFRDGEDWYTARTETVQIPVAGRAAPESFTIRYTKNGPLVSDDPPIALCWTAHNVGKLGLDAFLDLNLAENWSQFTAALDGLPAPSLNATYADVEGNIGFRTAGILPLRGAGAGLYPLPGAEAANRWRGTVTTDQMPRAFNPPTGYLAAANARVNAAGNGPLVSADNAPGYRIGRIQRVLSADKALTLGDMSRLQSDWRDAQAEQLAPALLTELSTDELSPAGRQAVELLRGWCGKPDASRDSAAALIFQVWYLQLAREAFAAALGDDLFQQLLKRNYVLNHALDALILDDAPAWWQGNKPHRLAVALERALAELANRLGPDMRRWRLDQLQQLTLSHELGRAEPLLAPLFNLDPRSLGGGPATVGRASYRYDRPFQVSHGATVRVVVEMKPVPAARAVIPSGQSGHPWSAHYADQFEAWLAGDNLPILAAPGEVPGAMLRLAPD